MLPALHRDDKHLKKTERFLKNNIIELSITGIRTGDDDFFKKPEIATIKANENIEIKVDVLNKGVGHNFPAGTVDSNQAWLELTATDSKELTFFESGKLDASGEYSSDTISYGTNYLDSKGNLTDRRNSTTEAISILDQRLIEAGKTDTAYYSLTIPANVTLPITLNVKLNWRKYSPYFVNWVFDNRKIPAIPVTVIDEIDLIL